jgi:hypothetical protein
VLGNNVPPKLIKPKSKKALVLKWESGNKNRPGKMKIDPKTAKNPVRAWANWPGYKGKD